MKGDGQELAIKRTGKHWRVYEIHDSDDFGRYGKVLRTDAGEIVDFANEDSARALIESIPDATEVDYPA